MLGGEYRQVIRCFVVLKDSLLLRAIVGALGSKLKVDASYLSPHVTLTSLLESITKQYKVSFHGVRRRRHSHLFSQIDTLFSHNFFELLSPTLQGRCRKVDRMVMAVCAFAVVLVHARTESVAFRERNSQYLFSPALDRWMICRCTPKSGSMCG